MTARLPPTSCLDNPGDQMTLLQASKQRRLEIMHSCIAELNMNAQITNVICANGILRYYIHLDKSNCLMSLSSSEHKIATFFGVEHVKLSLTQGKLFDIEIEIPVGNGDMLYCSLGQSMPERIQACFVSSVEEEKTLSFFRENYEKSYDTTVIHDIKRHLESISQEEVVVISNELSEDDLIYRLMPEAVDIILEARQASVSLLQRRLRIGYARAARVIDKLESLGIVGEFRCSKSREILITKDQWQKLRSSFPI